MEEKIIGQMVEVFLRHKRCPEFEHTISGKLVEITPEKVSISEDFIRETYTIDKNGKRLKTFVDTTEISERHLDKWNLISVKILDSGKN